MLKRILIFASLLCCLTFTQNNFANSNPGVEFDMNLVTLRAGTIVSVELVEELDPRDLAAGNAIDLMVRSNVMVNGKVVIASGAIAEGIVKKVNRGCKGDCMEVTITVENVQAVDGQRIYLRSVPHIMKAECCGKRKHSSVLNIGTKISSRVLNDVKINA